MFSAKLIVSVRSLLFHFVPFRVDITVFLSIPIYIIGRQYCCMALCEPAATELESKNAHGISPIFFGVFSRIRFLIFLFDFLLTWIVP